MSVNVNPSGNDAASLADMLASDYASLSKIDIDIADYEKAYEDTLGHVSQKRHHALEFAGPSVILSIPAFIAGAVIGVLIYFILFESSKTAPGEVSPYAQLYRVILTAASFLPFIFAGIILVIGSVRSKKKSDYLNSRLTEDEKKRTKRQADLQKEIADLKDRKSALQEKLSEYDDIVPEGMRTKSRMEMVKMHLANGRASTFEEAVRICSDR